MAAFADAGADMLFIDALESEDEMRALCSAAAALLPTCQKSAAGCSICMRYETDGAILLHVEVGT